MSVEDKWESGAHGSLCKRWECPECGEHNSIHFLSDKDECKCGFKAEFGDE